MTEYLTYLIWIFIAVAFLYFGYRNDYKRNPKKFWATIFGVTAILGLFTFDFNLLDSIHSLFHDLIYE